MSKYRSLAPVVRETRRQYIESRQDNPGPWLNRPVHFDGAYTLQGASLEVVKSIAQTCGIADRKDSRQKLQTLLANLLRYRSRRPLEMALKTAHSKLSLFVARLENHGFLNIKRGNDMVKRCSKVWPTERLLDCFEKVASPDIALVLPLDELVTLKVDGKPAPYKETAKTLQIKSILKRANDVNRKAQIIYNASTVSTALTAIFHRKLTLYGRLHTRGIRHHQGLSEAKRSQLTINGDSIVELDFKALHPHLLYAQNGHQLPPDFDPYNVELNSPELRPFLKECLLALLNAKGGWVNPEGKRGYHRSAEDNAEGGINRRIGENRKWRRLLKAQGITTARQIIELFIKAHGPIAHHFFSDKETGLRVMNKDAAIALDVVKHFTGKNIPILPIHDSFVVQRQYREELYKVMEEAYRKNTRGFFCPIE